MIVNSPRRAAFLLGFHVHLLRFVHWSVTSDRLPEVQDAQGCLQAVGDAWAVLLEWVGEAEHTEMDDLLRTAQDLHDAAAMARGTAARSLSRLMIANWDRIRLRSEIIFSRAGGLKAWFELGSELAKLRGRVAYVYQSAPIPDQDWGPLNEAADRLPAEDRWWVADLLSNEYRDLDGLAEGLAEAYFDISQCLAGGTGLPKQVARAPDSFPPGLIREPTGLEHDDDYSLCRSKGVSYHPGRLARPLIRALDDMLKRGIPHARWDDLIDWALRLEAADPALVKELQLLKRKDARVILKNANVWRTLIHPVRSPKGCYRLDL